MRPTTLLIFLFISVLLAGLPSCKREPETQPAVCRLTSVTDQLIETSGRLTDEMQRTFAYTNQSLTSIAERSRDQEATFQLEYANNRALRAISGQDVITLAYSSAATPTSATFTRGGTVQSTFVMEYTPAGQMSRIVESRRVLPANSLTVERAYTFIYDNAGNLTNERAKSTLRSGAIVEQETEFVVTSKPSPYTHLAERSTLTLIALSQAVETMPCRFWHINSPVSYKSYNLTSTGSRGNLREETTYAPSFDSANKLMSQDQTALLYQLSVPTPVTKKNRQSFVYQCE